MKTTSLIAFISVSLVAGAWGQSVAPAPTPYTVVSRTANSAVWQRTIYESAPNGKFMPHTERYVELATGLNHLVNGEYVPSSDQIELSPDGTSAAATNGQHQAYFPNEIATGTIKFVTPGGLQLVSRPIALAYDDGSNTVLIALLTNSVGAVLGANQVIYTNAFQGVSAAIRYTYTRAGFEQDVVLEGQLPTPQSLKLDPQTTKLQVITEFFNPPQPTQTPGPINAQNGLRDTTLTFGRMKMIQGRALLINGHGERRPGFGGIRTYKRWLNLEGRTFLIENVPYNRISSQLQTLPAQASATVPPRSSRLYKVSTLLRLLKAYPVKTAMGNRPPKPMRQLAQVNLQRKSGVVLDYVTLNSSLTNYDFQGDTTYYISGNVNLFGTTTIEGGCVFKYPNAPVTLSCYGPIQCQTTSYRPCVFTARDDNTVGATGIAGNTGVPSGYYADWGLMVDYSGTSYPSVDLHDLEFKYLNAGLGVEWTGTSNVFRNIQFFDDDTAFAGYDNSNDLGNILMANVGGTNFYLGSNGGGFYLGGNSEVSVENLTIANAANLWDDYSGPATLVVTNSLLVAVTNLDGSFAGAYNVTNDDVAGTFQTVGGGSYYLADDSPYRNSGTTNIPLDLLADLATKTTYPPILYSNNIFTTAQTFNPQAQRDTEVPGPDLGYHYGPLDWAFGGCTASNNITFTPGTAVGWFRTTSGWYHAGYGIALSNDMIATFQGTATAPDYWVRLNTVQENDTSAGYGPGGIVGQDDQNNQDIALSPEVHLFFTRCSMMSGDPGQFFRDDSGYLIVRANDSEFYSRGFGGYVMSSYLTNCLMDRVGVAQDQGYPGNAFTMQNCTFHGGNVYLTPNYSDIPISIRDCSFDGTTFTETGYATNGSYDYNAYTNGAPQLPNSGTHDVIVSNFDWQSSWFGNYYLPPGSPLLNAGDVPANQVGLYYFTTQTNQVPEETNTVSIGYHYVATDANGNPLETFGDGIPDYLDDPNGNGLPNWWQMLYFGNLNQNATDLDSQGNTLLYDYTNDLDPNVISFSLSVPSFYVNSTTVPVQVTVTAGVPYYYALLIDDQNITDAVWLPYSSSNLVATLGLTNGNYTVYVGLRGLPATAKQTWNAIPLTLDTIPPTLAVTNPSSGTVSQPMIQVQGYADEALSSVTFDLSNAAGIFTNQTGYVTGQFYDTNRLEFTTNYFQCYDVALTNGLNLVTIHAVDLAGNVSTTNANIVLDYSGDTNPPVLNVVWPQDNAVIAGSNFTLQASVDDPTAKVQASVTGANGQTNTVQGLVERSGTVWLQDLPLGAGTNYVTITATDAAGNAAATNVSFTQSAATVTIDPIPTDQLNQSPVNVSGTVSDPSASVFVNGVQATVNPDGNWSAQNVPVNTTGMASLDVEVYNSNSNNIGSQISEQTQPVTVEVVSQEFRQGYGPYIDATCGVPVWQLQTENWQMGIGGQYTFAQETPLANCVESLSSSGSPLDGTEGSYLDGWEYAETMYPAGDQFGVPYYGFNHVRTRVAVEPGEAPEGGTAVYLVQAQAYERLDYTSPYTYLTLPLKWLQVDGQVLVPSGQTHTANGMEWGDAIVVAPAGVVATITPKVTQVYSNWWHYFFVEQSSQIHLAIIDANNGQDLTEQTNTVIVGQQMNMYAQLSVTNQSVLTNLPLSDFRWTIPGYAISNFVANDNTGIVYTNFPTDNSNVVFYWVDGATARTIQCSANVMGHEIIARATFNVNHPLPQFTVQSVGVIAADTNYHAFTYDSSTGDIVDKGIMGGTWLHFGVNSSWSNIGIAFVFTNAPLQISTNTYGRYFLTQIVNEEDIRKNIPSGTNVVGLEAIPSPGLDTEYPYQASFDFWHLGGYSYRSSDRWFDSPGDELDSPVYSVWLSRTNSYTTYLMFQPSATSYANSIPVPMYSATWSWSGTVKTNGTPTNYVITSESLPSPTVSQTLSFPQWTHVVTGNVSFQTNNTPFNEN